jgi:hypothetical protein
VLSAVRARLQQIEDSEPHASERRAAYRMCVCMEPGGGSATVRTMVPAISPFHLNPSHPECPRVAVKTLDCYRLENTSATALPEHMPASIQHCHAW